MIKKILLILGVIGFGFINFSYGRYNEIGPRFGNAIIGSDFTNVHEQYLTLSVDKDINFTSTKGSTEKDIFALYAYQGTNGSSAYWFYWNTRGELSAYARDWRRQNSRGGKLTYYYLCDEFELPFTNFTGCVEYLYTGSDIQVVNDYLSFVNTGNDILYGQLGEGITVDNGYFSPFIAFNIPNKNKSIVFYFKPMPGIVISYNLPYRYDDAYGIDDEYSTKYHIEDFPDSLIGESPVIGGLSGGDGGDFIVDLSYDYTNQEVYDAYGEAGYYRSMCFSDFSLDDLTFISGDFSQFEPDLDDGIYYTGSTIIDLYNTYSGSRSFYNFFSHWYNLYKYSLTIDSFNSFVGYSKGLWRIGYKYYMAGLGSSSLNYNNYYNYCNCFARMNLSVYGSEIYSCGSVPSDVENYFNKGNNYGSGVLGNLSGDSAETPDEFFDALTNRFNTLLDSDYGDYSGIIPVYILIALMGLIFIRMISH